MAETSIHFLSNWENVTQAFNMILGDSYGLDRLASIKNYFKREFWLPSIRKVHIPK